ncbi:HTH-type transcriptional regulator DmlR [Cupriavidus yeoncheonensis]|uniref:HTH-type transcriptional regulator DmlR n=1 Tax=Cupriavidus yeoncheonensis TaxID=1462994 RepID=A0A916IPN0_9BURK|nr:LysR family transcriptional regulator [Cupriavidus yeoncheonensis]CAG2127174.1 HTH-type transcriptional regulator DmlR [Cupriavidus yeoncheonensis]
MRKNLDYGLLHAMTAFLRVVDAGSFTAAASQMALTTAQVSRLVSELEKRLQAKLLQRTTRRLMLTSVGERYANQCRSILDLVTEAESGVGGAHVEPSGRLRVRCMAAFGDRYVVPLVSKYCAMYPKVMVEYSTSQHAPDLIAEGVDVSVYLAQRLPDSNLVAQRLGETHGVLCAAPGYLDQRGIPRSVEELADHACLRIANPSTTPQWAMTNGKRTVMLDPTGPLVGDNPEVVLHAACSGLGIAMLPLFSAVDRVRNGELAIVLPQWRSPAIGVYLLMPSRKFLEAKVRTWIELLKSELPAALERDASSSGGKASPARRKARPV